MSPTNAWTETFSRAITVLQEIMTSALDSNDALDAARQVLRLEVNRIRSGRPVSSDRHQAFWTETVLIALAVFRKVMADPLSPRARAAIKDLADLEIARMRHGGEIDVVLPEPEVPPPPMNTGPIVLQRRSKPKAKPVAAPTVPAVEGDDIDFGSPEFRDFCVGLGLDPVTAKAQCEEEVRRQREEAINDARRPSKPTTANGLNATATSPRRHAFF